MLDYGWENPSTIMLTGDDQTTQEANQTRPTFEDYTTRQSINQQHHSTHNTNNYFPQSSANAGLYHHQHQPGHNVHSLFDLRAYSSASAYAPSHHHHHQSMLSIEAVSATAGGGGIGGGGGGYFVLPKSEEVSRPTDFASRIGLNLGGRTYFSSADDDFVNRLYRRPRPGEPGSSSIPRCQAEGCNADLSHSKHYHRRHKVCEYHSKASTVITAGLTQRFCQQCSRFHLLSEFDNGKRSCRKRLADHNRRRRKSQPQPSQDNQKSQLESARNSSSENLPRSPPDSGAQLSPSVTVAVSPPRMSLDCFRQKPYQATASTSASSSSLFFSNTVLMGTGV